MSKTVDQKVVEMQFDNKNFEKNVSKTLTTLDKLKKALKLDGAAKGLEDVQRKADSLRFHGLANTVDQIADRFTGLQTVGTMAMLKLAQGAADLGLKMAKSLTLDPIKTGFNEYELKMGSVQTIMAGTGESLQTVNKYLEELNRYSDQTIYSFSDMTSNIGKFTNAGVKLEDAVLAIKGVSNEAAISGANANQASAAMYNFAQALSSGYVKLIDWKSIENANMATKGFKEQLIETAVAAGTLTKASNGLYKTQKGTLINATKNFNDSLQDQWMTSDVLIGTLKKYADSTTDIGKKATAAATEVKTLTMLWDTLKEAAQSGWAQTWELVVGDFEESKKLFTGISNAVGGMLEASAKSRNDLLKGWKDLGGRDAMIEGLGNIAKAIAGIVKPIKEAFREIFPPATAKQLFLLTEKFKEFTSHLIIGEKTSNALKNSFKGVFAVAKTGINIVVTLAKAAFDLVSIFLPLGKGIVYITGALGEWVDKTTESIRNSNKFAQILKTVTNAVKKFVDELGKFLKETLKFDRMLGFFQGLFEVISKVALALGKFFGSLIRNGDLKNVVDIFNAGLFGGLIATVTKFFKSLGKTADNLKGFTDNLKGMLGDVRDILKSYQKEIQARTLMTIAKAVAILAGSLLILSLIDPNRLASALTAMATSMAGLLAMFKLFGKMGETKIYARTSFALLAMSTSLLILSAALKNLSDLSFSSMITGLFGIAAGLAIMVGALHLMPDVSKVTKKTSSLIAMSVALLVVSVALKKFAGMSLVDIGKALLAMTGALSIMVIALSEMNPDKAITKSVSLLIAANSLILLAGALKILSSMSWSQIGKSLTAMAGSLTILVIAMNSLKSNFGSSIVKSMALIGAVSSLIILGGALKILGSMSWSQIGRSILAMGATLTILVAAMKIMGSSVKTALTGAGSLILAANSLVLMGIALKILGSLKLASIGKALLAIAGTFVVLGVAGALLSKVAPGLLAIAGAMALFGVGAVALGLGLTLISNGILALAVALSGGATAIVAGLGAIILGVLGLVPEIVNIFGQVLIGLAKLLIDLAPVLGKAIMMILYETIRSIAEYSPMIVTEIMNLLINVLRAVADRVPELIVSIVEVINAIFKGFVEALKILDPKTFVVGIACVGMLAVIMHLLASLATIAPAALIGTVAFGVIAVALGGVIGILDKILGDDTSLKKIEKGGNVLQAIGTAIGKFIGGIIGGFGAGLSASLPDIATNLSDFISKLQPFIKGLSTVDAGMLGKVAILSASIVLISAANFISTLMNILSLGSSLPKLGKSLGDFMTNIKPFLDGAMIITPNMMNGVKALAGSIIAITAANVISGLTKWITGGKSIEKFGNDIASLGTSMKTFTKNLGNFSESQVKTVECACKAIQALGQASKEIPNEGGVWGWLAGDNSIGKFSSYLPGLGTNLNKFVSNLGTFSVDQVNTVSAVGEAIKSLASASKEIPNEGGVWGWLAGDNSIGKFSQYLPELGKNLNKFASELQTFTLDQVETVKNAAMAIAGLAKAANIIPNTGGLVSWFTGDNDISTFSEKLPGVGTNLKDFLKNLGKVSPESENTASFAGKAIAALAKAAKDIPNTGGLASWFAGDNDISKFAGKLPDVGTHLASFVKNLGTFSTDQVAATDCAGRAIAALGKTASEVPSVGGLASWFTGESDIAAFASKFPGVATNLASFVSNLGTFTDDQVKTTDCAARAIQALGEAASKVPSVGGLKSWFVGESDISTFADKFPGVATNLANFVKNLGTFSDDQVRAAGCAGNAIGAMAKAANEIPNTGGLVSWFTGDNDISEFSNKLPAVATGIKGMCDKLGGFGEDKVNSVKAATDALKYVVYFNNDVKDTEDLTDRMNVLNTAAEKIKTFINSLSGLSGDSVEKAKTNSKSFYELVSQLASFNIANIGTLADSMKTIGENTMEKFVNAFSGDDPKDRVSRAIRDLIDKMITTAETRRTDLTDKFKSLAESAIAALQTTTMYDKMKNAGKYFAEGFAQGITDNQYLANDAGRSLGNAAYNSAKKAIDAHSPSKKARKLGGFFGQGFINGIHAYVNSAYSESYSMADQANKGLTKAISAVDDILNGSMNDQPTIRPVLDLTDVESGASAISGMFNGMSVQANLNAISTGMKQRLQNGANDDVVSAINKLGNNLGNTGDTYNINGITYDDQSAISDAVRVLIRAATVERRS